MSSKSFFTRSPSASSLIARRLFATFPAPPSVNEWSLTATTGTGASGEMRETVPQTHSSSMTSPTTRILLSRMRSNRRRAPRSSNVSGMHALQEELHAFEQRTRAKERFRTVVDAEFVDEDPGDAERFRHCHVAAAIAEDDAARQIESTLLCRALRHPRQRLATVAVFQVRAIVKRVDGCPMPRQPLGEFAGDALDRRPVGPPQRRGGFAVDTLVLRPAEDPTCGAGLIGDDDAFETRRAEQAQRLGDAGEDVDAFQRADVTGIFDQRPITIQKRRRFRGSLPSLAQGSLDFAFARLEQRLFDEFANDVAHGNVYLLDKRRVTIGPHERDVGDGGDFPATVAGKSNGRRAEPVRFLP